MRPVVITARKKLGRKIVIVLPVLHPRNLPTALLETDPAKPHAWSPQQADNRPDAFMACCE